MSDKKEPQLGAVSGPKLSLIKVTKKELEDDLKYSPFFKKSDIKFLLEVYDCVYARLESVAENFYKNRKETNFLDTGLSTLNADEFRTSYKLIGSLSKLLLTASPEKRRLRRVIRMPSGVCSKVTSSCFRTPSGAGLVLSSYREVWCVVITLSSALVL